MDTTLGVDVQRQGRFVVQRHRATRLHYDLRLEIEGKLVSWAVPRGPTLDPQARRLCVRVDDHELDYFAFEGVHPRYPSGVGDVIVWDWGRWRLRKPRSNAESVTDALRRGDLHLELDGVKLRGRVALIRTAHRNNNTNSNNNNSNNRNKTADSWLLLHAKDEHAVEGWEAERHPRSVKSGRTNDEVAANG